jgi:hypothetical protein
MNQPQPIERAAMFWASNDDSWHSPETIAAVADLSTHTLVNWRAQGRGPQFVKSGKLIYYRKSDVLAWFKSFQPSASQVA